MYWDSVAHVQGGSSLLSYTTLELPLQAHPKVCLLSDLKASEVDNEY